MKYSESKSFLAINRHISKKALPDRNDPAGLDSFLGLDPHPAGQGEGDPVLAVHRQAVHQPGPQALIELGDELRKALHAIDEPLDLSAPDHDLTDLLDSLTQKNRMRMHTVMHSHPIFCPNLSTKGPNQVFFQSCLMNTRLRPWGVFIAWSVAGEMTAQLIYVLPRLFLFSYFPLIDSPIVPSEISAVTYPAKLKSNPTPIIFKIAKISFKPSAARSV